jgi:hypothetical protein
MNSKRPEWRRDPGPRGEKLENQLRLKDYKLAMKCVAFIHVFIMMISLRRNLQELVYV